ncbi:allophanate hydrolase [Gracilibacillus sp. YIM 98692]|uniref:allophanate hydrolase n=1 Tax=Gracilibacillus sp. YIM 98692 TaxID=2663532 RepID=UPI001969DD4B|nr:allophanate hydrolase [Gracilibacillus sp. YIM 98692]
MISTRTITDLQEDYKNGKITPEDVIEEIIEQAAADEEKNIWISPPSMEKIYPYLEKLKDMNREKAPLWGIPFAVKDNIDVAGVPTTAGCPDYAYTPAKHSTVVKRLVESGAIPVGKTNLDQFATGLVGTRSPYGETHNSMQDELISGGSSSGSAVAVARNQVAFSLGTDTAGSGRVPAALNGIVGFKPSLGAWSTKGVVPACESLDCVTVFSHTLEEALMVDAVVRGEDPNNPWSKAIRKPIPERPEKILIPQEEPTFFGPFAEEYKTAWEKTKCKLQQLHIPVEYVNTDILSEAASILYGGPYIAERWTALGRFLENNPGSSFPVTEQILRSGSGDNYDASSVFQAMHRLQEIKQEVKKLMENAILAMPTCGGTWTREQVRENPIQTNNDMGRFTNHCNLLDLSALAVPCEEAGKNLPFGVTLFGLADKEGLVLGTGLAFKGDTSVLESVSSRHTTPVAVCGLHMRGFLLEKQMHEHGAVFVKEAKTASKYKLYKLPTTPEKPGLIKQDEEGDAIHVEVWDMPLETFGAFTSKIPSPLGIGKVELEDGSEIPGFICEEYGIRGAEDITSAGGWHQVVTI